MAITDQQHEALVVATLATYSYSAEKAWALREELRRHGLFDVAETSRSTVEEVGNALKAAGYDRGGITYIIAPRVISLAAAIQEGALDSLADHVAQSDAFGAKGLIETVKGFGPKSAGIAWELMKP